MSVTDETGESSEAAFKRQLRERQLVPEDAEVKSTIDRLTREVVAWFNKNGEDVPEVKRLHSILHQLGYSVVYGTINGAKLKFEISVAKGLDKSPAYTHVQPRVLEDDTEKLMLTKGVNNNHYFSYWGNKVDITRLLGDIERTVKKTPKASRIATALVLTGNKYEEAFRRQVKNRDLKIDPEVARKIVDEITEKILPDVKRFIKPYMRDSVKVKKHDMPGQTENLIMADYDIGDELYGVIVTVSATDSKSTSPARVYVSAGLSNMDNEFYGGSACIMWDSNEKIVWTSDLTKQVIAELDSAIDQAKSYSGLSVRREERRAIW